MANNEKFFKVIGTVESCVSEQKGVSKTNKEWERFKVVLGGNEYDTFDSAYLSMVGVEGEYTYINNEWRDRTGQMHTSRNLIPLPKSVAKPSALPPRQADVDIAETERKILASLARIEAAVDRIEAHAKGVFPEIQV